MIKRDIEPFVQKALTQYPIVTILGPRQSGKTTLCQNLLPDRPYRSLEDPDVYALARDDSRRFLDSLRQSGAILDEIQRLPILLSYLQGIVDHDKRMGQFIIIGSSQILLMEQVSQSLAGRTLLMTLLPLSLAELSAAGLAPGSVDEALFKGAYPAIYARDLEPSPTYRSYYQSYVDRDVRLIAEISNLDNFQRFIRLCAGRIGQILNLSGLATEVGVSQPTIHKWLSVLEMSFVVFRLQPYFENFNKRIIKSPKLYFYDVGLAVYLLEISNIGQVSREPLRGQLFENLVILEAIKAQTNQNKDPNFYFFRDNHGLEVDLIQRQGNSLIPFEVKSTETYRSDLIRNLLKFASIVPDRIQTPTLIYAGALEQDVGSIRVRNFMSIASLIHLTH